MRLIILKAAFIAAILSSPWIACSQHYYVVIGAFAAEENASEFRGDLPVRLMDTSYTKERETLVHLYVLKTSDKQSAIAKTLHLQKEIESWKVQETTGGETRLAGMISPNVEMVAGPEMKTDVPNDISAASASSAGASASAGNIPSAPVGKYFKFKIESPEGLALPGRVHHVDFDNGRELAAYNSNTFVDLLRPGQTREPMAVVCGVFGYKEIQKYVDYSDPSRTDDQAYVDSQGAWVIPYKLERLEAGDVSPMYNVSFYKDAAVMRKPSQADLDELVRMMHGNPYYEITIHAHCNGKNKREIIAPGPDRNYFDVAGAITLNGSARALTAIRAETIRAYLMDNGVDANRTRIFAWGGSDMLVKGNDPEAVVNDRIEIEITRD